MLKMPETFDFETLIKSKDGKYVDKTALLYELATPTMDSQLFISRSRRFGKSLMLSTLKAMFKGWYDLFWEFAIDKQKGIPFPEKRKRNIDMPVVEFL